MKQLFFLFIVLRSSLSFSSNSSLSFSSQNLFDAVVKVNVVEAIYDYDCPWNSCSQRNVWGSGFLIEESYILTNAHVVNNQLLIEVKAQNGKSSYAEIIAIAHDADLALLKLDSPSILKGVKPLNIRDQMAELNEKIVVVGFPDIGETLCVTEGKVMQTEMDYYVYSMAELLIHRIDARAFHGNSGGPVLAEGEVIGILHQGTLNEIEHVIPTSIIHHFLKAVNLERIKRTPSVDMITTQSIKNPALRKHYQLDENQEGVLVRHIPENHFLYGMIFPGDVILSIDDHPLDNDGVIELENGMRIDGSYLIHQKFYGDYIDFIILRNQEQMVLNVFIDPDKQGQALVLRTKENDFPSYYIYGGLVFQPLDRDFWRQFDADSFSDRLDYYFFSGKVQDGRREIIMITQILPDEVNYGYHCNPDTGIVHRINGEKVTDMKDLIQAIEKHDEQYLHILTEANYEIILDTQLAKNRNQKILKRYGIPTDRSLDLSAR